MANGLKIYLKKKIEASELKTSKYACRECGSQDFFLCEVSDKKLLKISKVGIWQTWLFKFYFKKDKFLIN